MPNRKPTRDDWMNATDNVTKYTPVGDVVEVHQFKAHQGQRAKPYQYLWRRNPNDNPMGELVFVHCCICEKKIYCIDASCDTCKSGEPCH